METETIAVLWPKKFGDGVVQVNKEDFDPKIHKLPGEEAPAAKELPKAKHSMKHAEGEGNK